MIYSKVRRIGETETVVVVPVAGIVVVAISNAAIVGVVVPRAAAQHTVGAHQPLTL